jgi:hypothetical protein
LREQERRFEVYIQHPIDSLERDGLNGRLFTHARVVDQNIDPAQRAFRVSEQASRGRHVANVTPPGEGPPPPCAYGGFDFRRPVVIVVMAEGDICALCRKGADDGCADSPTAASNERGAILELTRSGHRFAPRPVSEFDFTLRPEASIPAWSTACVIARAIAERPVVEVTCMA